jgi:hypothetical protein
VAREAALLRSFTSPGTWTKSLRPQLSTINSHYQPLFINNLDPFIDHLPCKPINGSVLMWPWSLPGLTASRHRWQQSATIDFQLPCPL